MKKLKVLFFGIVFLVGMVAVGGELTTTLTSEIAVAQLSDDVAVNSASRSVIKNDLANGVGYLVMMIGAGGLVYTVISKEQKEKNEKN